VIAKAVRMFTNQCAEKRTLKKGVKIFSYPFRPSKNPWYFDGDNAL